MFVYTFSSKIIKKISLVAISISVAVVMFLLFEGVVKREVDRDSIEANYSGVSASSDILKFISSKGWEVDKEPDEVREIIIPSEFDDVYNNYNAIQIKDGYDLTDYAGKRVKRWTYTVLNYPGYENEEFIKINILMYDDEIIGGDICSIRLDGFMHGFNKE